MATEPPQLITLSFVRKCLEPMSDFRACWEFNSPPGSRTTPSWGQYNVGLKSWPQYLPLVVNTIVARPTNFETLKSHILPRRLTQYQFEAHSPGNMYISHWISQKNLLKILDLSYEILNNQSIITMTLRLRLQLSEFGTQNCVRKTDL